MRLLSSSFWGQLIVREVRGNTEVESSQPCSHLIPFNFSGSYPSPPVPLLQYSQGWVCDQPGSSPALTARDAAANAGFHQEGTKTWDLTLLLGTASGDPPLQKHRQEAEDRGSWLLSLTQASLTDRAEGRGSDTAWDRKALTSTQRQSPTHPTDQRQRFWRITSGRWEK